jgi:hypothetical protein
VHRKLARLLGCLLSAGAFLLSTSSASAAFQYTSAELDVFNSSNVLIAQATVTAAATVSGTIYEIPNSALANDLEFGNATALSTAASAAGPYFVTFGVVDDATAGFVLGFSWDPTGNDPYGSFANNFSPYANPPTQATYDFSATYLLSSAALSAGDTAVFQLNATPLATTAPEPASLAMLATGGFLVTAVGRLRRKRSA